MAGTTFDRSQLRATARSVGRSIGALVLIVGAYFLMPLQGALDAALVLRVLGTVALLVGLVGWQVVAVLRSPHPAVRAGGALVVVAAFSTAAFAAIHRAISMGDVDAFTEPLDRTDALYFSMTTLTTVGYGDIAPVSDAARITVMIHMVVNLAVIGVAARVLGAAVARRRQTEPAGRG